MDVPKNVINLTYLISFLDLFAVGLTFPVLAPYVRSLGASHLTVGILSSSYSALQVLSGPIIGSWSDVRGRKSVFTITLFLSAICYFLLGCASSIYGIFIIRLLLGVVKHTQTLNKAIVADFVKNEENSKVFGKTTAFTLLGFVIGPIIAGHLTEYKSGFFYVCILTSLIFLLNIALVWLLPERKQNADCKAGGTSMLVGLKTELSKSIVELKKVDWKKYWDSFLLKFLFILSTTIFFVNQSLYLKERFNLSQKYVGYGISVVSVVGVIAAFLSGFITKKFYSNKSCNLRAFHSFSILTATYVAFYFAPNYYVLLVLFIPYGVCTSLLRIVTMEIMFNKCGEGDRGSLTGASDSIMSLARFAAPLSAGIVGDVFSENAVMLYALVPGLVGSLVSLYLTVKEDGRIKSD